MTAPTRALPRDSVGTTWRGFLEYFLQPDRRAAWGGPFNGQAFRQQMFLDLEAAFRFPIIVETGTHRGTTTEYLLRNSRAAIHTVETTSRYRGFARARFLLRRRVRLHAMDSRAFLRRHLGRPEFRRGPVFFYLDAHWFDDLPLREECELILRHGVAAVVMIDDFEVPGDPGYGFDDYGPGHRLSLDLLRGLARDGLSAFVPRAPAEEETGARRGCVVIGTTHGVCENLSRIARLAPHPGWPAPQPPLAVGRGPC